MEKILIAAALALCGCALQAPQAATTAGEYAAAARAAEAKRSAASAEAPRPEAKAAAAAPTQVSATVSLKCMSDGSIGFAAAPKP